MNPTNTVQSLEKNEVLIENFNKLDLIHQGFTTLFPEKEFTYTSSIIYNSRLAPFNANIRVTKHAIEIVMHEQWCDIDDQIKLGLIESLLGKVFKRKQKTFNITLYKNFLKTLPSITAKTHLDPYLELSFNRVNQTFFENGLEKPNLKWGQNSTHKLAHYNFQTDSIIMSAIFKEAPESYLDFVMYHEMLHKHHKFTTTGTRDSYHSTEFKRNEQKFPNAVILEKEISQFARKAKRQINVSNKTKQPLLSNLSKNSFLSRFF